MTMILSQSIHNSVNGNAPSMAQLNETEKG